LIWIKNLGQELLKSYVGTDHISTHV